MVPLPMGLIHEQEVMMTPVPTTKPVGMINPFDIRRQRSLRNDVCRSHLRRRRIWLKRSMSRWFACSRSRIPTRLARDGVAMATELL